MAKVIQTNLSQYSIKHYFIGARNIQLLNKNFFKSLEYEHPDKKFINFEHPTEHHFVSPIAPMTLVKTKSVNEQEIFADVLWAIKRFKFNMRNIHLIIDDEDLKEQLKCIR